MPGGLARVTLNLYEQFLTKYFDKYTVTIITGTISNSDFIPPDNLLNLNLPELHKQTKFNKFLWYLFFSLKLHTLFKRSPPDIVIGISTIINFCLLPFQFNRSYKLLITEHGAYEQRKGFIAFIRKVLYKHADLVISLTERDKIKFEEYLPNVTAIPNFTSFYQNTRYSCLDNKKILCIGRFTKEKGVSELVSFITPFLQRNLNWQLTLIGEGPLENLIKEKISNSNLENNILIRKPVLDIQQEYLSSSIYILPSKTEGFPMVLLEAKSFGLPIVSFNCPTGPSEIIKDEEDGFLIPMGRNDLFLEKLQLLINERSLRERMGAKALVNIKAFHPDKVMAKWVKILDE